MKKNELRKRIEFISCASEWIDTKCAWIKYKDFFVNRWLDSIGYTLDRKNIDWCSLFIIHLISNDALKDRVNLAARSWLRVGVRRRFAIVGDLVVFWRVSKESWQGHVGIFVGFEGQDILVLGGNQNGGVNISKYKNTRLIDYVDISEFLP